MLLDNKVILITGASSGLGKATAITLSNEGAKLILIGRDRDRLNETLSLLLGSNHLVFSIDITNYKLIEEIIMESVSKLGPIAGFVHCAGIEKTIPFRNMRSKYYEELFAINNIAGFELARIISKKKYIASKASFVFISSIFGKLGKEGLVGYCASKAALVASVKAMSLELSVKGVRCNTVLPGVIQTEMLDKMFESLPDNFKTNIETQYPLGLGEAEDVADLCLFLVSEKSKWITGSDIVIDGGYSCR